MYFVKAILTSSIFGLFAVTPAFGSSSDIWNVVRLSDKLNGSLKCREQPDINAPFSSTFGHGELVKTRHEGGSWVRLTAATRGWEGESNCWVSKKYIQALPPQIRGKIYRGTYRYLGTNPLTCRKGVGYSTPASKTVYFMRSEIRAINVSIDESGQTWFRVFGNNEYCYVPALSDKLLWDGERQDPNVMCNYLRESC